MPRGQGGGPPDAAAIRAARGNIRYHLRYIGYLTARRNWLAGARSASPTSPRRPHLSVVDYLGEVPWEEDAQAKALVRADQVAAVASAPLLADQVRGMPPATHYADLDF